MTEVGDVVDHPAVQVQGIDWMKVSVCGIFTLLALSFLKHAEPVLLPVILSLLLMLIFAPFVDVLHRSLRLPKFMAAATVVLLLTCATVFAIYHLRTPVSKYLADLEDERVQQKLGEMFRPVREIHTEIQQVVDKVQELPSTASGDGDIGQTVGDQSREGTQVDVSSDGSATRIQTVVGREPGFEVGRGIPQKKNLAAGTAAEEGVRSDVTVSADQREITTTTQGAGSKPVTVSIQQDPVSALYASLSDIGAYFLSTVILFFFLLAYGDSMAERIGESRGTPELLKEIKKDVSIYLFTISYINVGLGVCISAGLYFLGVKDAYLFGLMAALLNFIPYAGAVIGTVVVTLITAMQMQSVGVAVAAAAIYFGLSSLEGNVFTPAIIGKRFELNPIIVFLWVLAWAAIWGLPGMLIGLPLLMGFRIICAQIDSLTKIERAITL